MTTTTTTESPPQKHSGFRIEALGLRIEGNLGSLSVIVGRWDMYARIEVPQHRWAWLALVKDGPSVEAVAGPVAVTVSWDIIRDTDPKPRVWAWRRARKVASAAAAAPAGEG